MPDRSRLVRLRIVNIGCIGPEGLTVELDDIVCLVGANNCGKSRVLRAYELALGSVTFSPDRDLCKRAGKDPAASAELWVHIPEGMANIAEDWKSEEDGKLLVRSKWTWSEKTSWKPHRETWNPKDGDYSTDSKASGLDPVFQSRLPKPFRIGTLEDPDEEHKKLLTLIVQPVADRLKESLDDGDSALSKALADLKVAAHDPVEEMSKTLDSLREGLNRSHSAIFPDLQIDFQIALADPDFDPMRLLLKESGIRFREWAGEIDWASQGTGSQRALFWTMLQVRSGLDSLTGIARETEKNIGSLEKEITKLEKEAASVKKEETKLAKEELIKEKQAELEALRSKAPEQVLEERGSELALPGYMLLIDEPEVALHPNAIRSACSYLYGLSEDPMWQVMISTHSPQFIDPLRDHTTIIRLDRAESNPSPRTYRSDTANFSDVEKDDLKMLNRFDTGLAEMFFGQYPVLVEGDTEFAAFQHIMENDHGSFPHHNRPVIVRARGKYTLAMLIRMLRHFKVNFAILHDSDSPLRRDGKRNSAWTANGDFKVVKDRYSLLPPEEVNPQVLIEALKAELRSKDIHLGRKAVMGF
ncbi:AAA family ATPase, partial [Thermodesulfobacteriota bacterium]